MQSDSKEIYKLTSIRTGESEQVYKDIGNFVQKAVSEQMKKPKSLIIKLKGVGFWFLRKSRIERMLSYYPPYYEIEGFNDFETETAFLNFVNKKEMYDIFKARLRDYDKYLDVKKQVKEAKHEFNKLQEEQETSVETSKDNS